MTNKEKLEACLVAAKRWCFPIHFNAGVFYENVSSIEMSGEHFEIVFPRQSNRIPLRCPYTSVDKISFGNTYMRTVTDFYEAVKEEYFDPKDYKFEIAGPFIKIEKVSFRKSMGDYLPDLFDQEFININDVSRIIEDKAYRLPILVMYKGEKKDKIFINGTMENFLDAIRRMKP